MCETLLVSTCFQITFQIWQQFAMNTAVYQPPVNVEPPVSTTCLSYSSQTMNYVLLRSHEFLISLPDRASRE